jgi:hypothetical protein
MDLRIKRTVTIVPDDGSDGFFWRNGERWLRERGKESRILDLAPYLEARALMDLLPEEEEARTKSKEK